MHKLTTAVGDLVSMLLLISGCIFALRDDYAIATFRFVVFLVIRVMVNELRLSQTMHRVAKLVQKDDSCQNTTDPV
jgi:hypothetical protein